MLGRDYNFSYVEAITPRYCKIIIVRFKTTFHWCYIIMPWSVGASQKLEIFIIKSFIVCQEIIKMFYFVRLCQWTFWENIIFKSIVSTWNRNLIQRYSSNSAFVKYNENLGKVKIYQIQQKQIWHSKIWF